MTDSNTPAAAPWATTERDALRVVGADAATYLHSQVSQDLLPMQVGECVWTFVLEPTGKVCVLARVWRIGDDEFVLDTDKGFGAALETRLRRFKIRVKAEIEPVDWATLDLVEAANGDTTAARIEAGWPAMGSEIHSGDTIPAETGIAATAVSFTKGCYPGQELVERMDSRGASAPRLLQVVDVASGTSPGDALLRDGQEIGTVTSVAGTRALAYVKRSALAG